MKYLLIITTFLLINQKTLAQKHEIGLFLGGSNTIADVGPTFPVNPNDFVIGAIYKWNKSPRYSFRASAKYANIHGEDEDASDKDRQKRDYSFENAIREVSVGVEYNFWKFDLNDRPYFLSNITPYAYSGLSFFHYDALFLNGGKEMQKYNSHSTFAIPLIAGIKTTLARKLILAFEVGARYTFTDDLDGSNPVRDKEPYDSLKFGNTKNNDWYVFTGFTLTYTFGEKPCHCPGDKK